MRIFKKCYGLLGLIALSGCNVMNLSTSNQPQMGADRGFDSKPLTELKAGIWVDPNGCQHWIIDDGIEGYLSNAYNQMDVLFALMTIQSTRFWKSQ